jgi:hypothetical protein
VQSQQLARQVEMEGGVGLAERLPLQALAAADSGLAKELSRSRAPPA